MNAQRGRSSPVKLFFSVTRDEVNPKKKCASGRFSNAQPRNGPPITSRKGDDGWVSSPAIKCSGTTLTAGR